MSILRYIMVSLWVGSSSAADLDIDRLFSNEVESHSQGSAYTSTLPVELEAAKRGNASTPIGPPLLDVAGSKAAKFAESASQDAIAHPNRFACYRRCSDEHISNKENCNRLDKKLYSHCWDTAYDINSDCTNDCYAIDN